MMITRTTGITHGTPLSVVSRPRLVLQIRTSTKPPTAETTIVSTVTLIGGAASPVRRRRAAPVERKRGEQRYHHDQCYPAQRGAHVRVDDV